MTTTRDEYEAKVGMLQVVEDLSKWVGVGTPEVMAESAKAMLLCFDYGQSDAERQVWFPKSQLGFTADPVFGVTVYVRKAWVARQRMWWLAK